MDNQIKRLLKDHNLRLTQSRADVISVFLNKGIAISHSDIELEIYGQYDRVTIYRTLKSFLDKGLIHKVLDDTGVIHYALCQEACSQGHHDDNHVHFKCENCGETTCLDHVHIPEVNLPVGFVPKESNFLVGGVCPKCRC